MHWLDLYQAPYVDTDYYYGDMDLSEPLSQMLRATTRSHSLKCYFINKRSIVPLSLHFIELKVNFRIFILCFDSVVFCCWFVLV